MKTGEKIQEARRQCGLTQEQLAGKLSVSRSAVARWEADRGLPDVENLKSLARLLGVSVDYLLEDGEAVDTQVLREAYSLTDCGTGSRKEKKDRLIRAKFPTADIYTLLGKQILTGKEKLIDNVLGFVFEAPFGVPQVINSAKNMDKEFYLVETAEKQFFVCVTDEFIETRQLARRLTTAKYEIGGWEYTRASYRVP